MPKRIVDGDGVWKSDKLNSIDEMVRAEYANLIPLADANGVFHCDPYKVWSQVYSYNRHVDPDSVTYIISELAAGGLLYRWKDEAEKTWGYFVGIDKPGRLPGASRRGFNDYIAGPVPDLDDVKRYVAACRTTGLVYFIQGKVTGRIKIGVAKSPPKRLSSHQTGSPEELILLAVTPGGRDLEESLHKQFSEYRLHGEWFEPSQELEDFINTCASVDSPDFEHGIPKLLGVGVGVGVGLGMVQEQEDANDMSVKQKIMDKSREILGVRIFPGDNGWSEIKSLARIHGSDNVIERFEQWAKTLTSPPTYPLTGFLRVADAILAGKLFGAYPSKELEGLINDLAVISSNRVLFNLPQRAAIGRLLQENQSSEIKASFEEYWGNIEGDDYLARRAAQTFTEVADQLLYTRKYRREKAKQQDELIARLTQEGRAQAEAEFTEKRRLEAEEAALIEDTL